MPPRKKTEDAPVVDGVDVTDPSLELSDTPDPDPDPVVEPEAEATPEELAACAEHGVDLATLRAIRGQVAADISAAVVARQDDGLDPQADYCGVCLPNGWPAGGNHLECPHGTWKR